LGIYHTDDIRGDSYYASPELEVAVVEDLEMKI
jgi:hypothetical protein